jgi:hypothetical protein
MHIIKLKTVMKKLLLLSMFVFISVYGYAQTENEDEGTDASQHGTTISELAKNTTAVGKEKGIMISSAARAKSLIYPNPNARAIRGDAKPEQAATGGKPTVTPPVTTPTTGVPVTTPVGKPVGVPIGKPTTVPGGN